MQNNFKVSGEEQKVQIRRKRRCTNVTTEQREMKLNKRKEKRR